MISSGESLQSFPNHEDDDKPVHNGGGGGEKFEEFPAYSGVPSPVVQTGTRNEGNGDDGEEDEDEDEDEDDDDDTMTATRRRHRRHTSLREMQGGFKDMRFRAWLWRLLSVRASKFGHHTHYWPSRVFEAVILVLIVVNTVMVVLFSDDRVRAKPGLSGFYFALQLVSLCCFSLEYGARFWSCVEEDRYSHWVLGRLKWFRKPLSLLDLICLIPFYIDVVAFLADPTIQGSSSVVKSLQLVRVLTFLRLERQSKSFQRLSFVFKKKSTELSVAAFLLSVLILVASVLMFYVEQSQESSTDFHTIFDSMWWAVITLTTVGYGDVVPTTPGGRAIGAVFSICGIALFALPAGILGSGFVEILYEERETKRLTLEKKILREQRRMRHQMSSAQSVNSDGFVDIQNNRPKTNIIHCPNCAHQIHFS